MNEIYEMAFIVGGCLFAFGIIAPLISSLLSRCWAWVDDSKQVGYNVLFGWVVGKCFNLRRDRWGEYRWESGEGNRVADGDGFDLTMFWIFCFLLPLAFLPALIVFFMFNYEIAIALLTLYTIAHLARYSRRHKKVFDKHVSDPKAHKE